MVIPGCLRWRCRALTCMRGAVSLAQAAQPLASLPNGTGTVGRPLVQGWTILLWRWQCRALTFMVGATSLLRVGLASTLLPSGTAAVGQPSGLEWGGPISFPMY